MLGHARGEESLRPARQTRQQARPVEVRARIGLAAGGNVAVRGDLAQGKDGAKLFQKKKKSLVLRGLEFAVIGAFELDADREIVAALAPAPARSAGVPGALPERHELDE